MPYGIPNEKKEQTRWMEKCVSSVMSDNPKYPESRAIAICKAQLKKNNWKVKKGESELSMRDELWELEEKIRAAIGGPTDMVRDSGSWVEDIFDDYVIIHKGDKRYKVDWSLSGEDVNIDWDTAVEVERKTVYEPVSKSEGMKIPNVRSRENQYRRLTMGPRTIT